MAEDNNTIVSQLDSISLQEDPMENTISILVATDNHLGFMERDPIRGDDSIKAFEEILKIASDNEVDMILLGGDLFHDNKPSRKTLYSTIRLLRSYCMGDKPCSLEFLSDQSVNFHDYFSTVNYQDPNFNISIPVFSVNGNHDDPSGFGSLAALDILAVSGFVNYFGRPQQVDNIKITPILLQKGTTKLAIYGLGHVRDERLHRTLRNNQVKMVRPTESPDEWFNLMVLHQNRAAHGPTSYIPENFLEDFLDLIIWGHEHECLIDPVLNLQQNFYVSQPGSSVATSLVEGEAKPKHVSILKIKGRDFEQKKFRLRTVRPFILDEVDLSTATELKASDTKSVQDFLTEKVNELIERALNEWRALNENEQSSNVVAPLPLIRLKVAYTDRFTLFNNRIFGDQFVDRVANPQDILYFHRKRNPTEKRKSSVISGNIEELDDLEYKQLTANVVEDLLSETLESLQILPENEFNAAVGLFVEKEETEAIEEFFKDSLERTRNTLVQREVEDEDKIQTEAGREKQVRQVEFKEASRSSGFLISKRKKARDNNDEMELDENETNVQPGESSTPTTVTWRKPGSRASSGRGRGRGRRAGRRTGVGAGRGKTTKSRQKQDYDDFDDELETSQLQEDSDSILGSVIAPENSRRAKPRATRTSKRQKPVVNYKEQEEEDSSQDYNATPPRNKRSRFEDNGDYVDDAEIIEISEDNASSSVNTNRKRKAATNAQIPSRPAKRSSETVRIKRNSSPEPVPGTTSRMGKEREKITIKQEDDDYFDNM